jgi:hypothetical protein
MKSGNKKLTEVVLPEKNKKIRKINFDDESIISGLDFDVNNKYRGRSNFKDMNSSYMSYEFELGAKVLSLIVIDYTVQ